MTSPGPTTSGLAARVRHLAGQLTELAAELERTATNAAATTATATERHGPRDNRDPHDPRDPATWPPLLAPALDAAARHAHDLAAAIAPPDPEAAPFRPPPRLPYRPPAGPRFADDGDLRTLDALAAELTAAGDAARIASGTAALAAVTKQWAQPLARLKRTCDQLAATCHLAVLAAEPEFADEAATAARHLLPSLPQVLIASPDDDRHAAENEAPILIADPVTCGNSTETDWDTRIVANAISVRRAAQRERMAGRTGTIRTDRLEAMAALRPDPVSGRLTRRRFLAFDPRGMGQMIELVGDVGACEGLAVYVPGTGTNLTMSHVNTEVAENLVRYGAGRIACLIFLGGTFPQDMWAESGDPLFAHAMSPRLVACGRDVQTHLRRIGRAGLPVTVIGHSFGGSVVGDAECRGLHADRVVYVSAAGAGPGVRSASQWRNSAPAVARFSLTAPGDPIELTQIWSGLRYPDLGFFDIMDGIQRLDTGFYDSGEPVFGTRGHGGVFDADCDAFRQIARVVVGAPVVRYVRRSISARGTTWWALHDGRLGPTALAQITAQRRPDARAAPIVVSGPGRLVPARLSEAPAAAMTVPVPGGRTAHPR